MSILKNTIKLSSGYEMPVVGIGTSQLDLPLAIEAALSAGYRHIDTATVYKNEEAIGECLKRWFAQGGKLEDLFITTKLPFFGNRASDVEEFLNLSLKNMGVEYVDMYLIHTPFALARDPDKITFSKNKDGTPELDLQSNHLETWQEMEKQVEKGKVRSIGLSNFNESQISDIWDNAKIKPSNLQIELHLLFQQKSLRNFCNKRNIAVTAFSILGSPGIREKVFKLFQLRCTKPNMANLFEIDEVKKIAAVHCKTPAQVLLRHAVQNGIIVIPKSSSPERIKQNIDIFNFNLSNVEMAILNGLDRGTDGRILDFLFFEGIENHPYYPFKEEIKLKKKT